MKNKLPAYQRIPQDVIGDIAILKFPKGVLVSERKKVAIEVMERNKNVKVVLEKVGRVSGRLRKHKTKWLAGEKRKDTVHKESGCVFKLNVDETYFSARLSEERKRVAEDICKKIKNKQKILVMFAGVGPFPIVIAKKLKRKNKKVEIVSSEINKKASGFAVENVKLNKVSDYVDVVQGDSRKLRGKFDVIVMPRPNLKTTFLDSTMKLSKKGTVIYYYGFGGRKEVLDEVKKEVGQKVVKIKIRKAGDIGVRQWRWLASFKLR